MTIGRQAERGTACQPGGGGPEDGGIPQGTAEAPRSFQWAVGSPLPVSPQRRIARLFAEPRELFFFRGSKGKLKGQPHM